jgi:hypothetical protein
MHITDFIGIFLPVGYKGSKTARGCVSHIETRRQLTRARQIYSLVAVSKACRILQVFRDKN